MIIKSLLLRYLLPLKDVLLKVVDFDSINTIQQDVLKAKIKVDEFQSECYSRGIEFSSEKNLVFAYIVKEYCTFYKYGKKYGVNKWACARFNIAHETFRKLYSLDGIIDFMTIMQICEYGELSRGISAYLLLVYEYSPYTMITSNRLLKLNKESDFARRVA